MEDYKIKLDVDQIKMDLKVAENEFDALMGKHLEDIQSGKKLEVEELFMSHDYIKKLRLRLEEAQIDSLAREALVGNLN